MKLLIFLIIWFIGIIVALFGYERIREYKCYQNPRIFLCLGITLAITMSWILVFLSMINEEFSFPKRKKK